MHDIYQTNAACDFRLISIFYNQNINFQIKPFINDHHFSSLFDTIYLALWIKFFQLSFHGELLRDETNDRTWLFSFIPLYHLIPDGPCKVDLCRITLLILRLKMIEIPVIIIIPLNIHAANLVIVTMLL